MTVAADIDPLGAKKGFDFPLRSGKQRPKRCERFGWQIV